MHLHDISRELLIKKQISRGEELTILYTVYFFFSVFLAIFIVKMQKRKIKDLQNIFYREECGENKSCINRVQSL